MKHRPTSWFKLTLTAAVTALAVSTSMAGAPVAAQAQPEPALNVVLIVDQSGSMWARNDPQTTAADGSVRNPGWRIIASNLVAEWLATDPSDTTIRLSVIMFGTDAKVIFPLQDVRSADAQAAVQKAIAENNEYAGATDILEALQLARAELDKGDAEEKGDTRRAVIFLSDGVCEPKPQSSAQERQACEKGIREMVQQDFGREANDPIYTIALTADAFRQSQSNLIYKNLWQEIALTTGGEYYEPSRAEGELLPAMVSILQRMLSLPNQEVPQPAQSPVEIKQDVPAGLLQVGFTAVKYEPGIEMTVIQPDGSVVAPDASTVRHAKSAQTESYRISQPAAGSWTIKFSGNGKVILLAVPYAQTQLRLDRTLPTSAHPQGKPMNIRVRVLDADRAPLTADTLTVDVALPSGAHQALTLTSDGGAYATVLTDTRQTGAYTLGFSGAANGRAFSDTQPVKVVTAPWLRVIGPESGDLIAAGKAIPVQAQLMLSDQPVERLEDGSRLEAIARLIGPDGAAVDTQFLRAADGVFSGTIASDQVVEGDLTLRIQLDYISAGGERYEDISELALTMSGARPAIIPPVTAAGPAPTSIPFATPQPAPAPASAPAFTLGELTPIYLALAGLAFLLLLAMVLMATVVSGIRRTYQKSLVQQNAAMRDQRARDLTMQLQSEQGWQVVAAQIVADALAEPAAIDTNLGILNATIEPSPRFTLTTHDGREVTFTTDPQWMKKAKLVNRHDRIVDVSELTATSHTDANMLWYYILSARNMAYVTPPSYTHWFVIVREAEKARLTSGYSIRKRSMRQLPAPRGGRA